MHIAYALARGSDPRAFPMFTVYDHPHHFVVRLSMVNVDPRGPVQTKDSWTFDTLEAARAALDELQLTCMARQEKDEPVIVETWF